MIHTLNTLYVHKQLENLDESPDWVNLDAWKDFGSSSRSSSGSNSFGWGDTNARAFGYLNHKKFGQYNKAMVVGGAYYTHGDLGGYYREDGGGGAYRKDFKYAGRYWKNHKIISFWDYPPKGKMKKLISDIEKVSGDKIWNNGYRVEVINNNGKYFNPMKDAKNNDWSADELKYLSSADLKIVFIPLEEYGGSGEQTGKEIDHQLSPLLKQKKVVPSGLTTARIKKGGNIKQRFLTRKGLGDSVEHDGQIIESPDMVSKLGLHFRDSDALPFGMHNGKVYIGSKGDTHYNIRSNHISREALDAIDNYEKKQYVGEWKRSIKEYEKELKALEIAVKDPNHTKDHAMMHRTIDYFKRQIIYVNDKIKKTKLTSSQMKLVKEFGDFPSDRDSFKYPGRIWKNSKVISFWSYPKTRSELVNIIKQVEREAKVKIINNGWKIEVFPDDKVSYSGSDLVPVEYYKNSGNPEGVDHILPPTQKQKKIVPSTTRNALAKKGGNINQKFLTRRGLGDSVELLGKIVKEIARLKGKK